MGLIVNGGAAHHRPGPAAAALNLGEEGCQPEVGVLCPDVERMVVALGTTDPQAEEPLGRQLGLHVRLDRVHRIVDRAAGFDVSRVADRGQERADDLVPGFILLQAAIDPGLVAIGPVILSADADLQQIAQLDTPEDDELGAWQATGRRA